MKSLRFSALAAWLIFLLGGRLFGEGSPFDAWDDLARRNGAQCVLKTNGRDTITAEISNRSREPLAARIPAGLVCDLAGPGGGKVITLRDAPVAVDAGAAVEVAIPAAALSSKNGRGGQGCVAICVSEAKLAPLLAWLASRPDVPRQTTQLVVLCLLEDVRLGQWMEFLRAGLPKSAEQGQPSGEEVAQAMDALAILREIRPASSPALMRDAELKLRALRNPATRARAMQIYGISLPPEEAAAIAPDFRQLLHSKPGDNCPVCRARSGMQPQPDAP